MYFSDLSVRFIGGLNAALFIDYSDSVPDATFLNASTYPVVRGVADFYVSYMKPDANGTLHVPFACAQEICGPSNVDEYDPVPDLALARMVLRAVLRYSLVLNRDAHARPAWTAALEHIAAYPTTTAGDGSGRTVFAEARAMQPNETIPWSDNARYPIDYFAPMHPAGELGLGSDPTLLAVARNTIDSINSVNGWHPTNGLCMAWPSATRVANASTAGALLDNFEAALHKTQQTNLYPNLGGGGIEQVGGTLAINELMLQSFEGFLRFFPAWPLGESGSFAGLRARGGVIVAGQVSATGTVSNVQLSAATAVNVTLLSPFTGSTPPRTAGSGVPQPVECGQVSGEGGGALFCVAMPAGTSCDVLPGI